MFWGHLLIILLFCVKENLDIRPSCAFCHDKEELITSFVQSRWWSLIATDHPNKKTNGILQNRIEPRAGRPNKKPDSIGWVNLVPNGPLCVCVCVWPHISQNTIWAHEEAQIQVGCLTRGTAKSGRKAAEGLPHDSCPRHFMSLLLHFTSTALAHWLANETFGVRLGGGSNHVPLQFFCDWRRGPQWGLLRTRFHGIGLSRGQSQPGLPPPIRLLSDVSYFEDGEGKAFHFCFSCSAYSLSLAVFLLLCWSCHHPHTHTHPHTKLYTET